MATEEFAPEVRVEEEVVVAAVELGNVPTLSQLFVSPLLSFFLTSFSREAIRMRMCSISFSLSLSVSDSVVLEGLG